MQLTDILKHVTLGAPRQWKNLQVFPLMQPNGHDPSYTLIDDLLERGQAEISELNDGGSVPTIKVLNHADSDALILDGTELRGAKQNRMVNVTVIVGNHSDTPIPVSCVERGRWAYRARGFASSKRTVASKLRNRKAHMVAENLARMQRPTAHQGEVWEHVDGYLNRAAVHSASAAFDDAYTEREATTEEYLTHLQDLDAYGAVVAVNGELIGLDLVDHRDTFKKLWTMLLRGYAFDASLDSGAAAKPLTQEAVQSWLRTTAAGARLVPHELTGTGQYYSVTSDRGPVDHVAGDRVASDRVAGGVTVHAGRVVHVALFPSTAP
jgi:hypothetical protein